MVLNAGTVKAKITGDASGLSQAAGDIVSSLGSIKGAFGAAAAAGTAFAAASFFKESIEEASAFEQEVTELQKLTSSGLGRELGDDVRELAEQLPIAREELSKIASQAARFGVEGADAINKFTESIGKITLATDLAADEAGKNFAKIATVLEEPTSNIQNLADVVNKLGDTMATSQQEILDSTLRSSAALSNLGASTEEVLSLNAIMNEVSVSARRAGTGLRRLSQELQNPKKVTDFAKALNITVSRFREMRDADPVGLMTDLAKSMSEGGKQGRRLKAVLSTTSRQTLGNLSKNLDQVNESLSTAESQMGAVSSVNEEAERQINTLSGQWSILKNKITDVFVASGKQFLPVLRDDLIPAISSTIPLVKGLSKGLASIFNVVLKGGQAFGSFVTNVIDAAKHMGGLTSEAAEFFNIIEKQRKKGDKSKPGTLSQRELSEIRSKWENLSDSVEFFKTRIKESTDLTDEQAGKLRELQVSAENAFSRIVTQAQKKGTAPNKVIDQLTEKFRKFRDEIKSAGQEFANLNAGGELNKSVKDFFKSSEEQLEKTKKTSKKATDEMAKSNEKAFEKTKEKLIDKEEDFSKDLIEKLKKKAERKGPEIGEVLGESVVDAFGETLDGFIPRFSSELEEIPEKIEVDAPASRVDTRVVEDERSAVRGGAGGIGVGEDEASALPGLFDRKPVQVKVVEDSSERGVVFKQIAKSLKQVNKSFQGLVGGVPGGAGFVSKGKAGGLRGESRDPSEIGFGGQRLGGAFGLRTREEKKQQAQSARKRRNQLRRKRKARAVLKQEFLRKRRQKRRVEKNIERSITDVSGGLAGGALSSLAESEGTPRASEADPRNLRKQFKKFARGKAGIPNKEERRKKRVSKAAQQVFQSQRGQRGRQARGAQRRQKLKKDVSTLNNKFVSQVSEGFGNVQTRLKDRQRTNDIKRLMKQKRALQKAIKQISEDDNPGASNKRGGNEGDVTLQGAFEG